MTAVAPKIRRLQLSHQVAEMLRKEILSGRIPAGTWLRQDHLARQLGVSPIPVREAFKVLAAQGLVEHVPYRGIRVVRLSADELEDLYEVRALVEARAAYYAALEITANQVKRLEELCEVMEACATPQELAHYRETNRVFHLSIAEISRRSYLIRLMQQLWLTYPTMLWSNYSPVSESSLPSREATDDAEHRAIVAALRSHDAEGAAAAMREHVGRAGAALVAFVRSQEGKGP